jgi:hypothetical protein
LISSDVGKRQVWVQRRKKRISKRMMVVDLNDRIIINWTLVRRFGVGSV